MKITPEPSHLYPSQRAQGPAASSTNPTSFSSVPAAATSGAAAARQADFTSMTRQEMFDWMNDQIRSGKMSLDESSPFLGMTMKISAATGQAVDMATDTTRVNFIQKARLGIERALSSSDPALAERLTVAIDVMNRQQGQAMGV